MNDTGALPSFSIVIPMFNAEQTLPTCLESLKQLDYPAELLQIIFVDNHSTDKSKLLVTQAGYTCLDEPIPGACSALATGVQSSTGTYIAFTHADCVVERGWIRAFADYFLVSSASGAGGTTLGFQLVSLVERFCESRRLQFQNGSVEAGGGLLPWLNFVNAAVHRQALLEAGGFDLHFRQETELDLSWRMVLAGETLGFAPRAVVRHRYRRTVSELWKQKFYIGRAAPKFARKYRLLYPLLYVIPYRDGLAYAGQLWRSAQGIVRQLSAADTTGAAFSVLDSLVYSAFAFGGAWEKVTSMIGLSNLPAPLAMPDRVLTFDDGEMLQLVHARIGDVWKLEGSARLMWQMLASGKTEFEIVAAICTEFEEADATSVEQDLILFQAELAERQLC